MVPAPGKPCQPPRAFCPATEADLPHKPLISRDIAFRACVMTGEARKRRASRSGSSGAGQESTAHGKFRPEPPRTAAGVEGVFLFRNNAVTTTRASGPRLAPEGSNVRRSTRPAVARGD